MQITFANPLNSLV